jgi:Flp pilus assembly protein TadD
MSLPCDTNRRLAGPVGTTPIQWAPPGNPPVPQLPTTSFLEPGEPMIPGYLATARAHAHTAPVSRTALARLAQAELSAGDTQAAVVAATLVLDTPDQERDLSAELAAVQVLRAGGVAETAREHIENTVITDDVGRGIRARLAIECGNLDDAQRLVQDTATFDGLLIAGWLAMRECQHPRAIALFRRADRLAGPTPDVLVNTGYSYAALGHMRHAIKATRRAQMLAPHKRMIAFNLVNFHLAVGAYDAATRALGPLHKHYPDDVQIALALAHIALRAGDRRRAHKILQQARTSSSWVSAPLVQRAELQGNLAVLRWINGERSLPATRKVVLEQLELSDYESLSMASLLPGLLPHFSDQKQLAVLLKRLETRHDASTLMFLRVHDAILRRDAEDTVALAVQCAETHPFSPVAAAVAVQLLADLAGDRDRAITLGVDALKRAPGDALLVNNLAYVLALAGRTREARTVLGKLTEREDTPALVATRGLVEMLAGNVRAGLTGYVDARELAVKQGSDRVALLATLNLKLALHRVDRATLSKLGLDVTETVVFPCSAEDDPVVWLLTRRAEHEGIPVSWSEDTSSKTAK